jgi:hypothetical protein
METLSMRDKWRVLLDRCMEYSYWRGVVDRAGGAAEVSALRTKQLPPSAPVFTIDLAHGIEAAEEAIDRARPSAIRVLLNSELVGGLAEFAGAEPLRGIHLRPVLLKAMPHAFAAAAASTGLLPSPFTSCARRLTRAAEDERSVGTLDGMTPSSASGAADL